MSISIESRADESSLSGSTEIIDYDLITADDAEFNAEVSENLAGSADPWIALSYYIRSSTVDLGSIDFSSYVTEQASLYKVTYDLNYEFVFAPYSGSVFYLANVAIYENEESSLLYLPTVYADRANIGSYSITTYLTSSQLHKNLKCSFIAYSATRETHHLDVSLSFNNIVVEPVSTSGTNEYQNGYNTGYAEGETDGYNNGYSQGYLEGEESGFQAGQDSVDIDSYYDAGYQAGYNNAYSVGYKSGYNAGVEAGRNINGSVTEFVVKSGSDYSETLEGTRFYVSSSGIVDVEANGQASYNTLLGTYKGETTIVSSPQYIALGNSEFKSGVDGSIQDFSFTVRPFIDVDKGTTNSQVNVYTDCKLKEVYCIYDGQKYYGSFKNAGGGYYHVYFDFYAKENDREFCVDNFSHQFYYVLDCSAMAKTYARDVIYMGAFCTPYITVSNNTQWSSQEYSYKLIYSDDLTGSVIQNQTDEITGALEEQKEVQQSQLEEQKEQTETQKGMLASIKEFFGSFFQNLIDSIIGIFVPSQEEMSELFNRLNDFFAETFGFLYYPFDFIIDAFNIFLEADSETGLTLPGFSIMGYEVWGNQTYDIASEPIVGTIFGYVRMGTGAMLAMWFVNYLRNFFDKRFGGGGN